MLRSAKTLCLATAALLLAAIPAVAEHPTVQLSFRGTLVSGTPVSWSDQLVYLLARDGMLWQFAPHEAEQFQQTSPDFRPFSQSEMRGQLLSEFGRGYDVSGTGNYLVVHPVGQRDRWAPRFEELYRSFAHYFTARGLRPPRPSFPLVSIVFGSQESLARYASQQGSRLQPGVLGYYSPVSNRVLLYDVTRGSQSDELWYVNAETIIHEATHQIAFNCGIHSRFAPPPRWLAEGLAVMFEAPGVWNSRHFPRLQDRVNNGRRKSFLQYQRGGRPKNSLAQFVSASDRLFDTNSQAAYAEAWALSFFLAEKEPAKYVQYLSKTAGREPMRRYNSAEQLKEFTDVFGSNLQMLEVRFLRFIEQL
jgi:hypothetical protein